MVLKKSMKDIIYHSLRDTELISISDNENSIKV